MVAFDNNAFDPIEESVGVVLATYNGEKFIDAQLKSLYEQTRLPDVILVSDAGSIDSTLKICEQYVEHDPNVEMRIMTNSDSERTLGVVENFEKGLSLIDTDFIFFCDQDDVWKPQKIESTIDCMKNTGASFCFSNADVVDKKLRRLDKSLWRMYGFQPKLNEDTYVHYAPGKESDLFVQLLSNNVVTGMTMCLRKFLVPIMLPFSKHGYHDAWVSIIASLTTDVVSLDENLVLYRQHESNYEGANKINKKRSNFAERISRVRERSFFLQDLKARLIRENCEVPEILVKSIEFENTRASLLSAPRLLKKGEAKEYSNYYLSPHSVIIKDCLYIFYASFRNLRKR